MPTSERTFHLRAWREHLRRVRQAVGDNRLEHALADVDAAWQIREMLADQLVLLEHLATVNGPLALAAKVPDMLVATRESPSDERSASQLGAALTQAWRDLDEALDKVPDEPDEPALHALTASVIPAAERALSFAVLLHRHLDPIAALEDDDALRRARALRERLHPGARILDRCPRCGEPLGADDRTVNGSFCEACGTRWADA